MWDARRCGRERTCPHKGPSRAVSSVNCDSEERYAIAQKVDDFPQRDQRPVTKDRSVPAWRSLSSAQPAWAGLDVGRAVIRMAVCAAARNSRPISRRRSVIRARPRLSASVQLLSATRLRRGARSGVMWCASRRWQPDPPSSGESVPGEAAPPFFIALVSCFQYSCCIADTRERLSASKRPSCPPMS